MKAFCISLFAALMLFFCASTVQAQNQSAENSNVITEHIWFDINGFVNCPSTGLIIFPVKFHQIMKVLPNGTWVNHFNVIGEGTDDNGDSWKWHDVFNSTASGTENRTLIIHGPEGKKLYMRFSIVINGKGEVVHADWDPLCD